MPTPYKRFKRVLFGRPLASDRLEHEKLSKKTALAVLSSDAISSVAYATDQILLVLAVLGTAALSYVVPISAVIAAPYMSGRQKVLGAIGVIGRASCRERV